MAISTAAAIIGGSLISALAAMSAASTQAGATSGAIGVQERQFQQVFESLAPYRALGEKGIAGLERLMLGTPEEVQKTLESRPGFKFRFGQGVKATEAGQAAKSGLLSGAAGKELTMFGQGFASAEFDKEFDRFLQLTNIGRGAQTTSAVAGAGASTNISNLLMQGGANQAQLFSNLNNAIQGGFQNYAYYKALNRTPPPQPFSQGGVPWLPTGASGGTPSGDILNLDFAV